MKGHLPPWTGRPWVVVFVLLPFCGLAQPMALRGLAKQIQQTLNQYHIPGAGIALVAGDSVVWQGGVGDAQTNPRRPITSATLFRAGSVSKTFTALGIMRLVKAGKLQLNDDVQALLPQVRIMNPWLRTHPVRVVHLLEHTAGFDDVSPAFLYQADQHPAATVRDLIRFGQPSLRCRWPPGDRYSYSNMDYIVAGRLIEQVSGQSFATFIRDHVFGPLGMPQTTFRYEPGLLPALATGHQGQKNGFVAVSLRETCVDPSASLLTTPADLATYLLAVLRRGHTFPDSALLNRMEQSQSSRSARSGLQAGYGLGVMQQLGYPVLFYGHKGAIYGYNAGYGYSPAYKVGFAVLLNGESIECLFALDKVLKTYLTKLDEWPLPTTSVPVAEAVARRLVGYYRNVTPRFNGLAVRDELLGGLTIRADSGHLILYPALGSGFPLLAENDSVFRQADKPVASILFTRTAEELVLLNFGQQYVKTPAWRPWLWLGGLAIAGLVSVISLLWCLGGRLIGQRRLLATDRVFCVSMGGLFVAVGSLLMAPNLFVLGTWSVQSMGYVLGSLIFAVATGLGLFYLIRYRSRPATRQRWWGASLLFLLYFLVHWNLLAVPLWAF